MAATVSTVIGDSGNEVVELDDMVSTLESVTELSVVPDSKTGLPSRRELLKWVRGRIKTMVSPAPVNFGSSFADGMVFCALIAKYCPDLLKLSSRNKRNTKSNLNLAFKVAQTELDVPATLKAEHFDARPIDEQAVEHYVGALYLRMQQPAPLAKPKRTREERLAAAVAMNGCVPTGGSGGGTSSPGGGGDSSENGAASSTTSTNNRSRSPSVRGTSPHHRRLKSSGGSAERRAMKEAAAGPPRTNGPKKSTIARRGSMSARGPNSLTGAGTLPLPRRASGTKTTASPESKSSSGNAESSGGGTLHTRRPSGGGTLPLPRRASRSAVASNTKSTTTGSQTARLSTKRVSLAERASLRGHKRTGSSSSLKSSPTTSAGVDTAAVVASRGTFGAPVVAKRPAKAASSSSNESLRGTGRGSVTQRELGTTSSRGRGRGRGNLSHRGIGPTSALDRKSSTSNALMKHAIRAPARVVTGTTGPKASTSSAPASASASASPAKETTAGEAEVEATEEEQKNPQNSGEEKDKTGQQPDQKNADAAGSAAPPLPAAPLTSRRQKRQYLSASAVDLRALKGTAGAKSTTLSAANLKAGVSTASSTVKAKPKQPKSKTTKPSDAKTQSNNGNSSSAPVVTAPANLAEIPVWRSPDSRQSISRQGLSIETESRDPPPPPMGDDMSDYGSEVDSAYDLGFGRWESPRNRVKDDAFSWAAVPPEAPAEYDLSNPAIKNYIMEALSKPTQWVRSTPDIDLFSGGSAPNSAPSTPGGMLSRGGPVTPGGRSSRLFRFERSAGFAAARGSIDSVPPSPPPMPPPGPPPPEQQNQQRGRTKSPRRGADRPVHRSRSVVNTKG